MLHVPSSQIQTPLRRHTLRSSRPRTRRQFVQSGLAGFAASLAAPAIVAGLPSIAAPSDPDGGGIAPDQTIDWHNHWFSPGAVEFLRKRDTPPRIISDGGGQLQFVSNTAVFGRALPVSRDFTEIDSRLSHLDRVGVARQVISWPTTLGVDAALNADDARRLWTIYNDELAGLVRRYPDRFLGLAALPTSDIPWATRELERAHRDLGLIGAVLPVGAFQTREGTERLRPIFDAAQAHHSHIYLHTGPASPAIPGQRTLSAASDDAPEIRAALETPNTFAQAAITLTQTGFLDPYPDVTVQIAMLGGLTPFLAATLASRPLGDPHAPDPRERLRRVYLDASTTRAPGTLEVAVHSLGADRILFGSDFPLVSTDRVIAAVRQAQITAEERQRIFVENGRLLLVKRDTKES